MKNKGNKYVLFIVLGLLVLGVLFLACKDITPTVEQVEEKVELKLGK